MNEQTDSLREAVGVFTSETDLQVAIDELEFGLSPGGTEFACRRGCR
jgi:hypothetical protein